MTPRILAAGLAALVTLTAPIHAQTAPLLATQEFDYIDYGILCFYPDEFSSQPLDFDTVVAIFNSDAGFEETRVTKTLTAPAVEGLVIGVVSQLPPGLQSDVTSIITHTNLNGTASPDELVLNFNDILTIDSWYMDANLPVNQGSYRFQTLRGDEVLYDVTFNIVPPTEYTGRYPDCISGQ